MDQWSNLEVEIIIADYFSMLTDELTGKSINKTVQRNSIKPLLNNRSDGSIEFKHQNISAVLIKLGLPFIKGYKPKWNYQQILKERIISFLSNQKTNIEPIFIQFEDSLTISQQVVNFNVIIENPPERNWLFSDTEIKYEKKPIKINYLEREQVNSTLGLLGEKLMVEYEKWRLFNLGKYSLADKIEWISQVDDNAGFDILSKNENGSDRYIEVKTTKLSKDTPIFFSKNDFFFAQRKSTDFHLYRVFNFTKSPKLFLLNGSYDDFCVKEAIQYKGYF